MYFGIKAHAQPTLYSYRTFVFAEAVLCWPELTFLEWAGLELGGSV